MSLDQDIAERIRADSDVGVAVHEDLVADNTLPAEYVQVRLLEVAVILPNSVGGDVMGAVRYNSLVRVEIIVDSDTPEKLKPIMVVVRRVLTTIPRIEFVERDLLLAEEQTGRRPHEARLYARVETSVDPHIDEPVT